MWEWTRFYNTIYNGKIMTQYSDQSRYYHHTFYGRKVVVSNHNDMPVAEIPVLKNLETKHSFDDLKRYVGDNAILPNPPSLM